MQEQLMRYSPDTGEERPYPSNAKQWREYHGRVAWLYNPWTGEKRDLRDIGSDVFGKLIVPDTEVRLSYCCEVEMPVKASDVVLVDGDPVSRKRWN